MLTEFNLFGVFMAPIALYAVVAIFITLLVRFVLWRLGALDWFWQVALPEVALYVSILCLLVLYV